MTVSHEPGKGFVPTTGDGSSHSSTEAFAEQPLPWRSNCYRPMGF